MLVHVIRKMYKDNEVKFTRGDISTGWIMNDIGGPQGRMMSPTLFDKYKDDQGRV